MKTLTLTGAEQRTRLSDSVYETLLEAILVGKLPPGTVVSEVSLARQLTVSRTPVHDALRQLSKDGLVLQKANHRAVVAKFTPEDIFDIFEMRKLLEGEAAHRAATRIDRQTLSALRATADSLGKTQAKSNDAHAADWLARWIDFDEDFHSQIAKASGSLRLWQDINRYRLLHRGLNKQATTVESLKQALQEHVRILEALEERNPDTAAKAMIEHIQEWQAYFVNHFPRN